MPTDEIYMLRCLELAHHGRGKVHPNPMVGAVIVHNGQIIGEGFHRRYGEAHAEVNAIASVKDPSLLPNATLYVNLEPCAHHGKTPPCTDLIIRKRIPRVIIACADPYSNVAGRGVRRLREAGVEVIEGVLEKEARLLNKEFMTAHLLHRPYIYLKWAQSADGFIDRLRADAGTPPVVLSSPAMLQRVHKWRAEAAAVMVGTRTALLDNPALTVRLWSGQSPVRVVLDRRLAIPPHYHLLDGQAPALVFTGMAGESSHNVTYVRIDYGGDVLAQVLSYLHAHRLTSLLVEGGACLLNHFLCQNLWDEIRIETAPVCLGEGVKAPHINEYIHHCSVRQDKGLLRIVKPFGG